MALSAQDGGNTGYSPTAGVGAPNFFSPNPNPINVREDKDYWKLDKLKRSYADYLWSKRLEINEQIEARRYRHGVHWTSDQIRTFNLRKQPVVTFNRVGRKIDGIVGLTEKMRTDPKAYPRSPRFQAGADLATAAIRSVMESGKWSAKAPKVAETAAIDGIGGFELILEQTNGAYDVSFEAVDIEGFFYDPRSKKEDFSDAIYIGVGKWVDVDVLKSLMPDLEAEVENSTGYSLELSSQTDYDTSTWTMSAGNLRTLRLVHICYQHRGTWCWALFTGNSILMQGESYFVDGKNRPICCFQMFSAAVDQDGDRYGFVRALKSAQDEINQRRSKGLHELNTRRIVAEKGAFDDIEKARVEAVRPDGVVERNKGYEAEFDDAKKQQDIAGQLKFLEDAKAEIENFGPNPALLGDQGVANRSGRAIKLMQESGIAELGPYIVSLANWKQRIYEAIFCALKKYWTGERWIRVTDDEGIMQWVQINGLQNDPMTGQPQIVNQIGQLDVDIVLDEGPDVTTLMDDMYETLAQIIPAIGQMMTPPQIQAVVSMLIETSPLPATAKRQFKQATMMSQQPNPMAEQAKQLQLEGMAAKVQESKTTSILNMAKAQQAGAKAMQPPPAPTVQPQKYELPPIVQVSKAMADINKTNADAFHKRVLGVAEHRSSMMEPIDYAQRTIDAMHNRRFDFADLAMRKYEADKARPAMNGGL